MRKRRDNKQRTEQDTERSILDAKGRLLLERAEVASLSKDEQIAALYYESAARFSRKM
jgi:hypothetical protein